MLSFLSAVSLRGLSFSIFCCIFFFQNNCKPEKVVSNMSKNSGNVNIENSNTQKSETKNLPLFCPEGNAFYVLFYSNPLDKPEGKRILDLRPNFVVTADKLYKNDKVPLFFHKDGQVSTNIRAISYITVDEGREDLDDLLVKIDESIKAGYDGVFFDEVEDESSEEKQVTYYAKISEKVKSFGKNKLVIFNPGEKDVEDWLFNYADIVSVENNGLNKGNENKRKDFVKNEAEFNKPFTTSSGKTFPSWRWLSVLGDPSEIAAENSDEANRRLKSFRKNKGLWFYSAPFWDDNKEKKDDSHWKLPDWLEKFAIEAKKETVKCGGWE